MDCDVDTLFRLDWFWIGEIMLLSGLWFGSKVTQRASKLVVHYTMVVLLNFLRTHGIGALPFPKPLVCGRLSSKSVSSFSLAQLDLPIRPLIATLLLESLHQFISCAIGKGINMRSYSFGSCYATWVLDKSMKYFRTEHTDILIQDLRHKSANIERQKPHAKIVPSL